MKAAVVTELGTGFHVADVEIAEPIGGEVLVDVKASGLCHTDLIWSQVDFGNPMPALFGHELAGIVAAVGPNVTEFQPGDHVVGCVVQACGKCRHCLTGRSFNCLNPDATLRTPDLPARLTLDGVPVTQIFGLGGFAQQALVHENQLVKIPDEIPFPQAALLGCGVVTGAGAVLNSANVQHGDTIVVLGAGGVGLNAINGALVAGATTIIAVDIADDKLEKARSFGATHGVNSAKVDPVQAVLEITGRGADAVFDFVGISSVTAQGLDMTAPGGGLYIIGTIEPGAAITVPTQPLLATQKRIEGVYMGSTTPKRDIPAFAELYLQGRFKLDELVSRQIALDEVDAGYEAVEADKSLTRVVITSL